MAAIWLITLIPSAGTGAIDSKMISPTDGQRARGTRRALPSFRPLQPEDSLFLPRCGHAPGSLFAIGDRRKWGDCHMKIKAGGRAALILATGLLVCLAAPSLAMAAT